MASQYSLNETRYPVGASPPASHRTPVTATTRHGRRLRTFMSIKGSVWIGRIGIDTGPFFVAGSASQIPFFSRSNWARPASVSKKIGRPSWPHAWHTYERLSLSTPAIGPITSSLGWTWPLPHRAQAAKSVGPKRPGIGRASLNADDLHALADPVGWQVDAAGAPALRHDLLEHHLTEHFELRFSPDASHLRTPIRLRVLKGQALLQRDYLVATSSRGKSQDDRGTCRLSYAFPPCAAETPNGLLVRSLRAGDA